jgi:GNAT superfamily N-acetyltransferase
VDLRVSLLADRPGSIPAVADLRWREWGRPPEPVDYAFWLDVTTQEAGRTGLPITFVCEDRSGDVLGAVGLDVYDLDERQETSPWVTGTIVRADRRGLGVGSVLMNRLEAWAAEHGFDEAWVGTASAAGFYERCGWKQLELFTTSAGQRMSVLHKHMAGGVDPSARPRSGVC